MRFPLLLLGLSAACLAFGQGRQGVYKPEGAAGAVWTINANRTLVWEGTPYLPVGLRIEGTANEIQRARDLGFKDVIVELPASGVGWKAAIGALESAGLRYLIAIDSAAPGATGITVEPQGYRVSGITRARRVEFPLPGATSALIVLAVRQDGAIQKVERVRTTDGWLSYEVRPPNDLEHVLLVYPEGTSLSQIDCWEGFDQHRDRLLHTLRSAGPGRGLRGILNPLGAALRLRMERSFVPTTPLFRLDFRRYLELRYRSVETVMRAWSMSASPLQSIEELARLVPLWTASRGVPLLWDPQTDKTYVCESRRSSIWDDIETTLNTSAAARFRNLATSISKVCDVPVLQDWAGWASPYESGAASLDGISARTSGASPALIADQAARAASSIFRWQSAGWFLAGRVDLDEIPDAATQLPYVLDDLASMGARGWFVRTNNPTIAKAVVQEHLKRSTDASPSQWAPSALFFPESASNPASILRLPGGKWWLPAPIVGNRIDLGSEFFAYRMGNGIDSVLVLWSKAGQRRVKLLMTKPSAAQFSTVDGSDPGPKVVRDGVEVGVGELPLIISGVDELPVPEPTLNETIFRFEHLVGLAEKLKVQAPEEVFMFRDAMNGFDRNPGGSIVVLRNALRRLADRFALFSWIEAEDVRETSFSEILPIGGASGNALLSLRSPMSGERDEFFAAYTFRPRTEEEVEVWIAAQIPPEQRKAIHLVIGGQELGISGSPVSLYGAGFGWYRLGVTRMKRVQTDFRIRVQAKQSVELAIDSVVFAPAGFVPNGVVRPDPMPFPPTPPKVKRP